MLTCLSCLVFGCGGAPPAQDAASVTHRLWVPAYVFGLFGSRQIDIRDICASGTARRFRMRETPGTLAVSVVTLGIYTPHEVLLQCNPGSPR